MADKCTCGFSYVRYYEFADPPTGLSLVFRQAPKIALIPSAHRTFVKANLATTAAESAVTSER